MQGVPEFDYACILRGIALTQLKGVHGLEQPLERLAQFMGTGITLGPSNAHPRFLESSGVLCIAGEVLELAQAGNVFAQKLRAEKALFLRDQALEVFK